MLAVILKKNIFAEGSEVLTLYSRDGGKVRAVARSIKSAKSRLSFGLQDLFLSDIELSTSRRNSGKSLPIITGVKPVQTFMRLRDNDVAVHLALYATELLMKSTPDHEPQPNMYDLFVSYLEHLDAAGAGAAHEVCRTCYTLGFLNLLGYGLDLKRCVACKSPLPADGEPEVFFSASRNGFLCRRDAAIAGDAAPIDSASLRLFAQVAGESFAAQDGHEASFPGASLSCLGGAVQGFASYVIERELKTAKYL